MSFNIEVRKKQLESLDQLISVSKGRIKKVLHNLGWTAESLQTKQDMVRCPLDKSHKLLKKNSEKHLEKCVLRNGGYDQNDEFLPEPPPDSKHTITIPNEQKAVILSKALQQNPNFKQAWNGLDPDPKTSNRLISTFSSDERLAIYDFTVKNTVGPTPPPEFTTIYDRKRDEDKPLSYEEMLALERDTKRRRAKYKSVHVNRKNHTEVIREVIENQMEEYKEWLVSKEGKNEENEDRKSKNGDEVEREAERPHSSISRNSTYSGSSRSTSRRYDDRESRDYYDRRRRRSRSSERYRYRSPRRYYRSHRRSRSRNGRRSRSRSRH